MSRRSKNTLSCLHTVNYEDVPPQKDDLVWCAMCGNYRLVLQVEVLAAVIPSWSWTCASKHQGRTLTKTFPGQKLKCEKAAIYHARRNHHTVTMYAPSGEVHHVYRDHDPNQLSLPGVADGVSDELPF